MQPGTWAQLTVSNQNTILGVGPTSGSMIHYSNTMPWNGSSKVIEIIGMDHNYTGGLRYVRYDEAANAFVLVSEGLDGTGGAANAVNTTHGYDHNTINPNDWTMYHRVTSGFTGTISAKSKAAASSTFTSVASKSIIGVTEQVAIGSTWWSGPFTGGGAQGSFMLFNCGSAVGTASDGEILAYNPLTGTWFYDQVGKAPLYGSGATYHCVIEYSPLKNVAVFGGGNAAPNKLWRLNADGTTVAMPNVPTGKGVGIQQGNFINDPVSGNFLLLSAGQLWELNPDGAGTWTQQTGSRTPPAGVGVPGPASYQATVDGVVSSAIADYGVIVYIKQTTSTNSSFYVYKPGAGTASADSSAPTVSLTAPTAGTVSGTVTVSANATDNVGVAGVQFKLDGVNLSTEATAAPYSVSWNTTASSNASHTLTAVARDAAGNQTTSAPLVVTVNNAAPPDTTPDAFTFTPQTGVALSTSVTSNAVTVSGINAASAVSVTGGSYSINGAAYVTAAATVVNGNTVTVRLTSSGSNSTQSCATLTIGGVSGQFCATTLAATVTPPATGTQDFSTRCAQPGVLKCVGFDADSDFNIGNGGTSGAYGQNSGILPPYGTTDYTRATRDTSVSASGGSSLRFTIPSNSGSDTSGSYFTNFSSDLSVQFDSGQEFYVQWRQRFSAEFLGTLFQGGGGWKQAIVGTGDQPGMVASSCSALELPVQNTLQRGFPQMYNSCTGSTSHGPYDPFEESFGSYDFKLQNARPTPYCLYSQSSTGYFAPSGNCFGYVANEWLTFQMNVKVGTRVGDEFKNSYILLWGARDGQASQLLFQFGPYNLSAGDVGSNQRYGKVWLLPYHTGKSATQVHPTGYTWYDELIISRNRIADPVAAGSSAPVDTTPDAFSFTSQTGVALSTAVTSNTVTPAGYTSAAAISVANGSYSINGGAFVTTAGSINPGQSVAVRQTSSAVASTSTVATLTIGGVAAPFTVTTQASAPDTTPDAISFTAQTGVAPNTAATSNTITPVGYNAATAISVSGGSYSINGGAFVTTAGTINPGQTVAVRQMSPGVCGATATMMLTIGGVPVTFSVSTPAAVTAPGAFGFTPQTGVAVSTTATSATITPAGYNTAAPISVSNGSYSVNGGAFVTAAGTIAPGQPVAVRLTSSTSFSTTTTATLTIGGVAGTFAVTTVAAPLPPADTTPDGFSFAAQTGVAPGTMVTSNTITVSGINAETPISISGGGSYSVNGGAYVTGASTVTNGSTVRVQLMSSPNTSTQVCSPLTIGGISAHFCVTTAATVPDTTPNTFAFTPQTGVAAYTVVTSNTITISGINTAAPIAVSNGSYSVNGAAFTTTAGTITNGSTVNVRLTTTTAKQTCATLTVGGVSAQFCVAGQGKLRVPAKLLGVGELAADAGSIAVPGIGPVELQEVER